MKKIFLTLFTLINLVSLASDLEISGYVESSFGSRFGNKDYIKDELMMSETVFNLDLFGSVNMDSEFQIRAKVINDQITEETKLDLREAYVWFMMNDITEVKLGRQILTWGTGDLMFINDMFSKDYQAMFLGRNMENLKAPSDALRISMFPSDYSVDLVLMPKFSSDNYITGERFTYFNPMTGTNITPGVAMEVDEPETTMGNMELVARVKRVFGSKETALYGYKGFHKQPNPTKDFSGMEFSKVQVFGGSVLGNGFGGITNFEFAYEDSVDDRDGKLAHIPNSAVKAMVGYNRELVKNLKLGLQFQVDSMLEYDSYKESMGMSPYLKEENRTIASVRLTKTAMQDKLRAELFSFYSPSDKDTYINPSVSYDYMDGLNISFGANLFYGEEDYTFFGQMEDNNNFYTRLRYSF